MPRRAAVKRSIVSEEELIREVLRLDKGTLTTLVLDTEPEMKKKVDGELNPWWIEPKDRITPAAGVKPAIVKLRKLHRLSGHLGIPYEKAVNNAKQRIDPDAELFKAGSRPWGKKLGGSSIIEHTGNFESRFYLDFSFKRVLSIEFAKAGNFHRVDERQVRKFLVARKDKPAHWRSPNLGNVREVRFDRRVLVLRRESI